MTGALKIAALALLAAFLLVVLKELGFKGARLFGAVSVVGIVFAAIEGVSALSAEVANIANIGGLGDTAKNILKIIGVGYVFGISAELCRELGENGVASAVQTAGRVEILLICLPFVSEITRIGAELISK